jgi:hypothetical protein
MDCFKRSHVHVVHNPVTGRFPPGNLSTAFPPESNEMDNTKLAYLLSMTGINNPES